MRKGKLLQSDTSLAVVHKGNVPVCVRCNTPMPGYSCLYGLCQGCIDREQAQLVALHARIRAEKKAGIVESDVPF